MLKPFEPIDVPFFDFVPPAVEGQIGGFLQLTIGDSVLRGTASGNIMITRSGPVNSAKDEAYKAIICELVERVNALSTQVNILTEEKRAAHALANQT